MNIKGRVQGVFYRASAQKEAQRLGLKGYVKNEWDDSVLVEVEGEEKELIQFIKWCRKGPPSAFIESIDTVDGEIIGYSEFSIKH